MRSHSITDRGNIFQRAVGSALAGLPIAYLVNIFIFIPLVYLMQDYEWWIIGVIGAIPFFLTSILRMYIIDWIWFKYKINIEPKHICKRLYGYLENIRYGSDKRRQR